MISKKTSLHYIKPQSIAPVLEPKTPDKRPYNEAIIPAGKENFKDLRRETKLDQEFEKGEGGFALTNVPSPFAGKASSGRSAWTAVWVILIGLTMAAGGAYLVYKYRLRVSLFILFNWRLLSLMTEEPSNAGGSVLQSML